MRKYFEKIMCLFFGHKWEYQYRRIDVGKNYEYHIHKCLYCEKYQKVKKFNK